MPTNPIRDFLTSILRAFYRLEVRGEEDLAAVLAALVSRRTRLTTWQQFADTAAGAGAFLPTANENYTQRVGTRNLDYMTHALEALLFPKAPPLLIDRPVPEWVEIHRELKRKGVTLQLLWLEYKEREPDGLQYSRSC